MRMERTDRTMEKTHPSDGPKGHDPVGEDEGDTHAFDERSLQDELRSVSQVKDAIERTFVSAFLARTRRMQKPTWKMYMARM
jgi:hypothetical protein